MYFLIYQGHPDSFHRDFINSAGQTEFFWLTMEKGCKPTMAFKAQQLAGWLCVAGSLITFWGVEQALHPAFAQVRPSSAKASLSGNKGLFCLGRTRRGIPVLLSGSWQGTPESCARRNSEVK